MPNTRILIVEDERLIAENNAILLRGLGYDITEIASSAAKAIASIERDPPDVVLLDIMLHGEEDGIQLAEQLRRDYDIPFVYATAYADDNILERAKITSPYGYVLKPFTERDLHSNIEMALFKHRSEKQISHLNRILYALNNVNQLIVREKDPQQLLKGICEVLINARTFEFAWAALLDEQQQILYRTGRALDAPAKEKKAGPLNEDGEFARCAEMILTSNTPYLLYEDLDDCKDCGMSGQYPQKAVLGARLHADEHLYGILMVVLDPSLARNEEIVELFNEVAMAVAFALHSLQVEDQAALAQDRLVKSEERYRLLAETAPDLILLHDLEGKISYINNAGQVLSGFQQADLIGKAIQDLVPDKYHSRLLEISDRSAGKPGASAGFEIELQSRDGETIPLEIISTVIREQKKASAFLIIGRDIRERRAAETELRKLSRAVEQSPVAVILSDQDGRISYINPKFTEMTGFLPAEVLEQYPSILRHPDTPKDTYDGILAELLKNQEWHGEILSRKSNGEEFWANTSITALRNSSGNVIHYVAILEDVTEQRAITKLMQAAQESYEDIFHSSSDAIYIQEADGTFVTVNKGAEKMYGYPRDFFIGKNPADLSAPGKNDLDAILKLVAKAFAGEPQRFEFWGRKQSGEIFPKDVQINRVHYFGKDVILATARDISSRLQIENDLKAAVKQAQESEQVKSLFLANMSHEIRTPLTSIIGYLDLIYGKLESAIGDDEQEYFDVVRRNSDRLTRTVHGILDLSQIEAGALALNTRKLELNQLLGDLLKDMQPSASAKDLKINFTPSPDACHVMADEHSLNSALSNILENAIIYTSDGAVEVAIRSGTEHHQVMIKDSGIGMSQDYLDQLWTPFTQESTGYTRDYQGLGLGLSIAKRCLDLNSVNVETQSEKGIGTTFTLSFPVCEPEAVTADDRETAPAPSAAVAQSRSESKTDGQHSILIVEDDPNARKLFGLFLRDDYQIHFASTVKQGKAVLDSESIDLVMTDLSLIGDEDGLVLVKHIRDQAKWNDLPVIALTAHAFVSDRDRCLEAGCNAFLTKPIFKKGLQETISEYLGKP